ncbi:hypothetical protein COU77_02575 [Candidatus Peregrinibacteria bacterium CG10_big_fil_rev_8_21_14_0_10_49_16]|nr:MAG: hypothetical protein COW95_04700 [Candidatus Peregrinibacteria bacterium CG22_combo_CG10-13_8_21_14_all_49_11]PIR51926.1 MAG: hypothetical protein COU77_02575 [Candidatus Peregrinibacteria bacterium CG10_big_fil_rev_8_21_14_0_10_49_16]
MDVDRTRLLERRDHCIETFMGSEYTFHDLPTVGHLRRALQEILDDLPEDDSLEISTIELHRGQFFYLMKEGIVQ